MEGAGFVELHFLAGARFCDQRARKRTANTVTISTEKGPSVSTGDWSREGAYVENPKQQCQTYCPAAAWSNGTRSSLPMCGVFRLSGLDGIFLSREKCCEVLRTSDSSGGRDNAGTMSLGPNLAPHLTSRLLLFYIRLLFIVYFQQVCSFYLHYLLCLLLSELRYILLF